MKPSQQGGDDVRVLWVVVVARSVEVGGHGGVKHHSVLLAVVLAEFQTRDLGDGIGFVGRLQLGSQQATLRHRLRRKPGIDARAAQKEQPLHPVTIGRVNAVRRDHEVLVNEVGGVGGVGVDASDLRGGHDHDVRLPVLDEALDRGLLGEVTLRSRGRDHLTGPLLLDRTHEC